MKLKFLKEEPKPTNRLKQFFYCFTRPLAEIADSFNPKKQIDIFYRRNKIANMQQKDFIISVAQLLYDEVLTHGTPPNISMCQMLCISEARDIFYEKKSSGYFDELNVIVD